jgi:hypothetical protein
VSETIQTGVFAPDHANGLARRTMAFRNLPLWIVLTFLISTFVLFLIWPINWPIGRIDRWVILICYVSLCYLTLFFSFRSGTRLTVIPERFRAWRGVIAAGAVAAIILLFPSAYLYTGKWPWEVLSTLQNQGDAYSRLQDQLLETAGARGPIALVRALAAPLTFAVLPLGILHWRDLRGPHKALVVATAFCSIIFSLLRGTDREFADLFIGGGSATLIAIGRQSQAGGRVLALARRFWKPALVILIFVAIAASLFTERKSERLGGYDQRAMICANDSRICADIDAPLVSWMPLSQRFGVSFFILSTCSGYYGLELAMEKDFQPTFGVGHSPAALVIYELLTGDDEMEARTYTYRNGIDGWNQENYWSSMITWIANDVGFPGAVLVLGLIGFMWGRTWRDATFGQNDPAAVLFCLFMVMLVYLPANNQVFASYDGYTTFFVWLVLWLRQPRQRLFG